MRDKPHQTTLARRVTTRESHRLWRWSFTAVRCTRAACRSFKVLTVCFQLVVLSVTIVLGACAGDSVQGGGEDPRFDCRSCDSFTEPGSDIFPVSGTVKQRLILEFGGRQYDTIGYLVYRQEPEAVFRAVVLGEMGGTMFDLLFREGQAEILSSIEGFPVRPLIEGIVPDIRAVFGIGTAEGRGALACYDQQERLRRVVVAPSSEPTTITYDDFGRIDCLDTAVPSRIRIENSRWSYRVQVSVLDISPEIKGDAVFSPARIR